MSLPIETLTTIDGDIKCEFRVGQNARFIDSAVDTDVVFDKEEFIKLFNEDSQYDPNYYKNHLDKCDLKINTEEQPEEWEKMFNAGINTDARQWVSESPYIHAFDRLDEVHHQMEEDELESAMKDIRYSRILCKREDLPNVKALVRIDFQKDQ